MLSENVLGHKNTNMAQAGRGGKLRKHQATFTFVINLCSAYFHVWYSEKRQNLPFSHKWYIHPFT